MGHKVSQAMSISAQQIEGLMVEPVGKDCAIDQGSSHFILQPAHSLFFRENVGGLLQGYPNFEVNECYSPSF